MTEKASRTHCWKCGAKRGNSYVGKSAYESGEDVKDMESESKYRNV